MQELIIPKGKTEKAKAQSLDKMLRQLAHSDAMRGVIMFELRMPDATGKRPLFQHLAEHGMSEESSFHDYIDTVHNVSRGQSTKDMQAAIAWAAINGIDLREPGAALQICSTAPPPPSHLMEVHRLVKPEMEEIPNARGENRNFPVRAKNPKTIKGAWEYIQDSHEAAVVEAAKKHATDPDTNGEDFKPPKLTTSFIRDKLAKGNWYSKAGVEAPTTQKPKGRIGNVCGKAEALADLLASWKANYEGGIAGVAYDDEWKKTQRNAAISALQRAGEEIDDALAALDE